jgi:hypothetical protein
VRVGCRNGEKRNERLPVIYDHRKMHHKVPALMRDGSRRWFKEA